MSATFVLMLAAFAAPGPAGRPAAGPEAVAAAAEVAFAATWPDEAVDSVEIRVVRLSGGAETAAPPLRVRFLGATAPRGSASAEVETQAAGGAWARTGWALLHVARFAEAAVLTRDVARGAAVTAADVRIDRVETTLIHDPLVHADALAGDALAGDAVWTATRTLRAGTPLTTRLVSAPAAAERGAPVQVGYTRGAVRIELSCEARERGTVGETIRATCAGTRATHRVRLLAPGRGVWAGAL